jgi:predicted AAA+ superfamily ATPase
MWYTGTYWIDLVERGWQKRLVVWLAGVRRSGKTVLCQSLPEVEYFDCELPSVRLRLRDPSGRYPA